jgi:hypothetical protein
MASYTIEWERSKKESVASPDEAIDLLRRLHQQASEEAPLLVAITSPDGADLTLGVGRDVSVCGGTSAGGDPPYFASRGIQEDGPDLVFFYLGEWTDFPASFGVPIEEAFNTARQFIESGERPRTIRWQEV